MAGLPRHARSWPQGALSSRNPQNPPRASSARGVLTFTAPLTATAPDSSTAVREKPAFRSRTCDTTGRIHQPGDPSRPGAVPFRLDRICNSSRTCNSTQLVSARQHGFRHPATKSPSCERIRSGSGWHTGAGGGPDSEILVRGVSYPQGFHTFFLAGSTSLAIDALQQRRGNSPASAGSGTNSCAAHSQLVATHSERPSTPSDAAVGQVEHFRVPEIRQVFQHLLVQLPRRPLGWLLPAAAGGYYKRPKAAPTRAQRF